jgi:hypothetical protein
MVFSTLISEKKKYYFRFYSKIQKSHGIFLQVFLKVLRIQRHKTESATKKNCQNLSGDLINDFKNN